MLDCWSFLPLTCSCGYERIADKICVKNSLPNIPTDNLPGIFWKMWGNQLSGGLYCKLLVASTAVPSDFTSALGGIQCSVFGGWKVVLVKRPFAYLQSWI